jgi:ABC-type dipeptide/oligopeptide/nickel transport system permease subunit
LPGFMIFITSIAFNLFSDGLRNAMEIRSWHEHRTVDS